MDLQAFIEPVIQIAHEAGAELLKFYKDDYKKENKADGSIVTEADFASDKIIREQLALLTPDIPIVTEETVEKFKDVDLSNKTYWCVDPLDGTTVFANHQDDFCILIALIKNGLPILGVTYFPVIKKIAYASQSNGAFVIKNGKKNKLLTVNKKLPTLIYKKHSDLKKTYILAEKLKFQEIIKKDTALQFLAVSERKYNAFCYAKESAGKWDVAANQVILEEAGGLVCDKNGERIQYGNPYKNKTSALGLCHPDLLKYLK